jgi:hypothetical protein
VLDKVSYGSRERLSALLLSDDGSVINHLAIRGCHLWQDAHHRFDKMQKSHRAKFVGTTGDTAELNQRIEFLYNLLEVVSI